MRTKILLGALIGFTAIVAFFMLNTWQYFGADYGRPKIENNRQDDASKNITTFHTTHVNQNDNEILRRLKEFPAKNLVLSVSVVTDQITAKEKAQRGDDPFFVRSRLVELDTLNLALEVPITLKLFDDVVVTAFFDQKAKASGVSNNTIWRGRILDELHSRVALVVAKGVVIGEIRMPLKGKVFQIGFIEGNTHVVREVDESRVLMPKSVIPKKTKKE